MTHIVLGYNFSARLGLSLNTPYIAHHFKRFQLSPTGIGTEEGSVSGFGDIALVGRWMLINKTSMKSAVNLNLLAGVKFPTGDVGRIREEVTKAKAYNALVGGSGVHQHEFGGVHEHDLALGSGSYDAIAGASLNLR